MSSDLAAKNGTYKKVVERNGDGIVHLAYRDPFWDFLVCNLRDAVQYYQVSGDTQVTCLSCIAVG